MRKLASVVEIETCEPIPGTDRLSVATMKGKGWRVVTGRNEFMPGEMAVYLEIDSFLDASDDRYAFLKDRCLRKFVSKSGQVLREGIRIKTVKLRGVVSQGLLLKLNQFVGKEIECVTRKATRDDVCDENGNPLPQEEFDDIAKDGLEVCDMMCNGQLIDIGFDLTEALHVDHYDEVAEALRPETSGNPVAADAMGKFPSDYIPKTDEERIQNLGEYFSTMKGRKFEVTEKNDGSSVTMFYSPTIDPANPFGVCSRNLRLKQKTENGVVPVPWKMADKYDAEVKIRAANISCGSELAFQGELVGPGVNGNRDLYKEYEWHVFKVWDITKQEFLLPSEARFICNSVGFVYVPVICEEMSVFDELDTVDSLLSFAEGKTANGHEREGLVFKSVDRPYRSFKAVSNRYLMKEQE